MAEGLAIRSALLEWAMRSATGELKGLDWVDTNLGPRRGAHAVEFNEDGEALFRHMPYTRFLPGPMAEAMVQAQERGEISAMEAVMMLMAKPEWMLLARPLIWSPQSPEPRLLAWMLERWGVEPEVHRHQPDRLSRIATRLPRWRPHRGTLAAAREMLEEGARERVQFRVTDRTQGGAVPGRPDLRDEAFTCREDRWWARRQRPGAAPAYRIEGGVMRHQPAEGPVFELVQEDVLIELMDGARFSRQLVRLLPAWASVRVITEHRSAPTDTSPKDGAK